MGIIPEPQKSEVFDKKLSLRKIERITVNGNVDNRIIKAASKLKNEISDITGKKISILTRNSDNKGIIIFCNQNVSGYSMRISEENIKISAKNDEMAFYAIQTIRQIIIDKPKEIDCCDIDDYPSFAVRGFYYDVSRGRVPKLEYLFKVVDILSLCKINQLQLYIEDAFDFIEYSDIIEEQSKLTADEILALDDYCYDHYIDLVPSLSTFGHLYSLLQSEKYKDLCELEDYNPKQHFWLEKMQHHTIDVSNEKSFELVCSLIDQYVPLFRSKFFNICCDETMDLCTGRNKDKNPQNEYYAFVRKIIDYISIYDKKVMMWADIALKYSDKIDQLPQDTVFLNWTYRAEPSEEQIKTFFTHKRNQIVCPGTVGWNRFLENIPQASSNIQKLIKYGEKYGAIGVLNTYWGDCGHINSFNCSLYGMAMGAQLSWNSSYEIDVEFEKKASRIFYGSRDNIIKSISEASECELPFHWWHLIEWYSQTVMQKKEYSFECTCEDVIKNFKVIDKTLETLQKVSTNDRIEDLIIGCKGIKIISELFLYIHKAENYNDPDKLKNDIDIWFEDFSKSWLRDNKESQLHNIKSFMYAVVDNG